MKSAEQWCEELLMHGAKTQGEINMVKAIQADARHAALTEAADVVFRAQAQSLNQMGWAHERILSLRDK